MPQHPARQTDDQASLAGQGIRVTPRVLVGRPATIISTKNLPEKALDKVSQSIKGKYAHIPYSSEDLIREKREEAALENGSS